MKQLLIIALAIITLGSCKKNPEDKYHVMPVSKTLLSYMGVAKSGSYYVFQDTVSGQIDTFTISDYGEFYYPDKCSNTIDGKPACSKRVYYEIKTTFDKSHYYIFLNSDCKKPNYVDIQIDYGAGKGNKFFVFAADSFTQKGSYYTDVDTIYGYYYSTYTLWGDRNAPYNDVMYIDSRMEDRGCGADFCHDMVFAKNIGWIGRKNITPNQFWKLIDKNIVL